MNMKGISVEESVARYITTVGTIFSDELFTIEKKAENDSRYMKWLASDKAADIRSRAHELLMLLSWVREDMAMGTGELEEGMTAIYTAAVELQGRLRSGDHQYPGSDAET